MIEKSWNVHHLAETSYSFVEVTFYFRKAFFVSKLIKK